MKDWQLMVSLGLMAAAAAIVVVLWTTTINALKEHEHRITKLEQQIERVPQ